MDSERAEGDGATGGGLRRVLGPFDATCIVIGAIIGVGIFFTPSKVAAKAGSGEVALLAWAFGGLAALLGALTFAELGSMYRKSGSQYEILRDAYNSFIGFLFVFCNATAVQGGAIAIIALICADNLGVAFDGAAPGLTMKLILATVLIGGVTAANAAGVRQGARIQNITVVAKVATLLLVAGLAVTWGGGETEATGAEEVADVESAGFDFVKLLCAAVVPAMFSFGGWQHCLWIGGEVRNPSRNVPLACMVGVSVVVASYLLVNWAYLDLLGHGGVAGSQALAADAVGVVWPNWGARLVAGLVAFSAFGVLNAQLLGGPRLIYAMAKDGRFFRVFSKVHTKWATPVAAILLLSVLSLILLWASQDKVGDLLTFVVFVDGTFFVLTGYALFQLRRRRPDAERAIRIPLVVPALFVLLEAGVVLGAWWGDEQKKVAATSGMAWIAGATLLYLAFFRTRDAGAAEG